MQARRSRTALVAGLSLAAHVGAVAVLALRTSPPDVEEAAVQTITPVFLAPRRPEAPSQATGEADAPAASPRPARIAGRDAPQPLPLAGHSGAGPPAEDDSAGLRAMLRERVGCARPEALDRAAREACERRLAEGAGAAPRLPLQVDPVLVAYYDAVARAKAPDGPPTPIRAAGALGFFEEDGRGMKGRPPAIGCSIKFGAGKKPPGPPNSLRLGPCFISPPIGSLTRDAHIAHPDEIDD